MQLKKLFTAVAAFALVQGAFAQTNLQTFYDLSRGHFTTTLEGFHVDGWGNTFFFIDYDYDGSNASDAKALASGSYFEIARCLNFWQDTAVGALSAQVEYNGGIGFPSQNFLFGVDYFLHNSSFSNTFNFKVLYKTFSKGTTSSLPLQFTFVWGMQDLFGVKGLRFSGFADVWEEDVVVFAEDPASDNFLKDGKFVFISEPQLWYNIGQHFGVPNLSVGTEVELSFNFAGFTGFKARPCIGTKWVF
ncbi:MAG: DUF5020 family protein [Candidatus Cryptobacteroides sp.]|jgi:hypothetical protein|nr:DUF5020 family protein [Rikenellaceae bacterium]